MASVKGILVVGVTIGAAVGVYYGLNKAFPKHVEKGEMPDIVASADQVFSQSISQDQPLPAPKAPPPNAPPTSVAPGEPPPVAGTTPAPTPQAEAPKPAEGTAAPTATAPAPEPTQPAEAPKASSSSQQAMLVPEPAPSASPGAPMPDTKMPSGEKPASKPAEKPPKPAEKPKPAPKPAPAKPAPAAPAAAAPAAKKPATETTARWWGDPKQQDPRRLNLSYAGQSAGQKGIALLFTGTFASAGVANWIKVTDANGKPAAGHWELGASPKMLTFVGLRPGRYTVTLSPDLKDAQGKTLGRKLSGPVTVQ